MAQLALLVPLLGGALLAATTSLDRRRAAGVFALAVAAATAALCLGVLEDSASSTVVVWWGNWPPRDGVALGIDFAADPVGAGLAAFAALLTVAALVVSLRLHDTAGHLFQALVLLFLASTVGFALAGDLFTLFVFFELLSVSAYALTGHLVDRRSPVEGALSFAVTNTAGSTLLLTGIALVYGRTGALNLAQIGAAAQADTTTAVGFALICTGFFVKAAIVPFHFWLADAYAAAPVAVCVLFAGVMSELGMYGVARVYWTAFEPAFAGHAPGLRAVLLALGALTALVGAAMCVVQRHLKRLLAFATISHMGVILIAVAMLDRIGLAGAAIYVVGDGLVKAGLFVAAGALQDRHGAVDDVTLYGCGRGEPLLGAAVAAGGLAIAGLPLAGPWLGRAQVEHGASELGSWWVPLVLVVADGLTGGAVLRVVRTVFLGRGAVGPDDRSIVPAEEEGAEEPSSGPLSPVAWVPALVLVAAGLAWGLVPGLGDAAAAAAARFADTAGYARAVMEGAAVAGPGGAAPPIATSAYLYGLLGCAIALAVGASGLVRRAERGGARAGGRPGRAGGDARAGGRDEGGAGGGGSRAGGRPEGGGGGARAGGRALQALRDLHSGRSGDYLAWLAAGAAVLTGACVIALTG